jgi:hypothetical protein
MRTIISNLDGVLSIAGFVGISVLSKRTLIALYNNLGLESVNAGESVHSSQVQLRVTNPDRIQTPPALKK